MYALLFDHTPFLPSYDKYTDEIDVHKLHVPQREDRMCLQIAASSPVRLKPRR